MGAPKQKWTAEEEAALKAGVVKHGVGKWRTILRDPEFSSILYLRSNVDLKDKWRNMSVTVNGFASREKSKLGVKKVHGASDHDEGALALVNVEGDEIVMDVKPLAVSNAAMQIFTPPKRDTMRLDNLIMEAITNLKEAGGSNKTAIASHIEEQYWPPQDFKRILSEKLKLLTETGKLVKVKRKYRIPLASTFPAKRKNSSVLPSEGRPSIFQKIEREKISKLTRAQVDMELAKMRTMTPEEAAMAAAQAVEEAEALIAAAEEAAREAEEAEADAEEALASVDAYMAALKNRATTLKV